jgi:tRNA(Ile2) C34 agmatinyltransferase TiaS
MKSTSRKCYCGGEMTARGSFGCSGDVRWKCKKCGRSIVEHKICEVPAEITIGK